MGGRRSHQRVWRSHSNALFAKRALIRVVNSVDTRRRLTLARARSSIKRSKKRKIVRRDFFRSGLHRSSLKSSQPPYFISKVINRGFKRRQRSKSSYLSITCKI